MSNQVRIEIDGRRISPGHPPYVVAELSANHAGKLENALDVVRTAKQVGADAVKLQTYTADTLTIDSDGPDFVLRGGLWDGRTLYDLYKEAHTPWEWHEALFAEGRRLSLPVFSTPFDETAVDLLERLGAPAFKIASFELVDTPLIRRIAAAGKPTIMSTGMGTLEEIDEAVAAFRSAGGRDLLLLHCISGYPTPPEQANLKRIPALADRYGCPVGLSDHTMGSDVAVAAVALGACFIEKHFILRRSDGGPDATFSMEPEEFRTLVRGARTAFDALGSGKEERSEVESKSKPFRRSIYVVQDVAAGEPFTPQNIRIIRPGFGLPPRDYEKVLGRKAKVAVARGSRMTWEVVD